MNVTATSLQGLDNAATSFDTAARKISVASSDGTDTVVLSAAVAGMLAAKNMYEANLNIMKAAQEMEKHLLDVMG